MRDSASPARVATTSVASLIATRERPSTRSTAIVVDRERLKRGLQFLWIQLWLSAAGGRRGFRRREGCILDPSATTWSCPPATKPSSLKPSQFLTPCRRWDRQLTLGDPKRSNSRSSSSNLSCFHLWASIPSLLRLFHCLKSPHSSFSLTREVLQVTLSRDECCFWGSS